MAQPQVTIPTIKRVDLQRLASPYPTVEAPAGNKMKGYYMAETPEVQIRWEEHLKTAPLSDTRESKRPEIQYLDPTKLQYDVQEGEHVAFYDADTEKLVALVVQSMVGNDEVVRAINGGLFDHLNRIEKMMRVRSWSFACCLVFWVGLMQEV